MPIVLRVKGFKFLFYGADRREPPHVHVKQGGANAKFWLEPFVRVAQHKGFRPHELSAAEKIVMKHRDSLLEAWHAFFNR
jgi:hypothetical protein